MNAVQSHERLQFRPRAELQQHLTAKAGRVKKFAEVELTLLRSKPIMSENELPAVRRL